MQLVQYQLIGVDNSNKITQLGEEICNLPVDPRMAKYQILTRFDKALFVEQKNIFNICIVTILIIIIITIIVIVIYIYIM